MTSAACVVPRTVHVVFVWFAPTLVLPARGAQDEALTSSLGALGRAGGVLVPAFGEELSFCMQLSFPRTLFRFALGARFALGTKLAGQGQFPSLVGP